MDAGKAPGDEPLPFLIPLGPEDDASGSGLYTPAPVRNSEPKAPYVDETRPPVVPPRSRPIEPLVLLDPLGMPATPPPPFGAKSAPSGFESAFLGKPVDDKPFQAPAADPVAKAPEAPFEAPRLDAPVKALPSMAIKAMSMPPTGAAFQPPAEGPAAGTFQFGGAPGPEGPGEPFRAPPPTPFAPPPAPEDKLPLTAPPPPMPGQPRSPVRPADRNALLRQPHTAPPIRLPGDEQPRAKPIPGMPSSKGAPPAAAPLDASPPVAGGPLGFVELLEHAGRFAFSTRLVLERFKNAPQPPAWLLTLHALAWVVASLIIRAGLGLGKATALLGPIVPPKLTAALTAGVVMASVGLMIGAAIVHALGKLSGGAAGFGRALIVVSLLAPLSALSAALSPVDALWWAPWALSTWLLGRSIVALYAAPVWQVGMVVGTFALFGGVIQYVGHRAAVNFRKAAEAVAPLSAAAAAATGLTPGLAASGPGGALTAEQAAVLEQLQSAGAIPPAEGAAPPSGLSMLGQAAGALAPQAGGAGQATGGAMGQAQTALPTFMMPMLPSIGSTPPTPEQLQAIKGAGQDAIRRATTALDDPRMMEGLNPAQKAQFRQARGSVDALLKAAQTGQKPSAADTQQLMQSLQQMMKDAGTPPQPAPTRRRRRRAAPADEQ